MALANVLVNLLLIGMNAAFLANGVGGSLQVGMIGFHAALILVSVAFEVARHFPR